ncbi:MAG: NTP transferase domain-containing protein [Candidatus Aegiribacteria sp.]|nr:NTP transferase domain-containing protein [Candidatus Aegiribacteria sp.]
MIRSAVILAAGMGTRLRTVLKNIPKGFLEISGKTLIEQSITRLLNAGIENIIIVTGHLSHYYDELARSHNYIRTVHNDIYADSGSMYSFYLARHYIREEFFLLESDLIYEQRALSSLLSCSQKDTVLLSGSTGSGDEVYAETSGNRLINLSKDKYRLKSIGGELVGISKFSLPLYMEMVKISEIMFSESLEVEYEQCVVETARKYPVYVKKVEDLIWAEIDDENHLDRVKRIIAPRIENIESPG